MACSEKPFFVIVKKTGQGFDFDNDVTYRSPLATHTLSQATGVMHPSLQVKSDWGMNKRKSISQLITGEAGGLALRSSEGRNIVLGGNKQAKYGILYPKGDMGYVMARIGGKGNVNTAPSVAELARLLSDLSLRSNVNVRGSPVEYKRLLDYIQFLMADKVTKDSSLYLARPNNYHVMDIVRNGSSLEDAYAAAFREDNSNNTIYGKAYFLTADRVAALASVIRGIPTVYESGAKNYYNLPVSNAVINIRNIIKSMLIQKGYRIPETRTSMNAHSNRTQELITPGGRPVITSGPLFAWFLNTRNVGEKSTNGKRRIVGTDFHKLSVNDKVLVIFYWVFNYPHSTGVNTQVIEYFLAILDSFHDFTSDRATNVFKNIWPGNATPYMESRTKTRNGINQGNIPTPQQQHKFLVKLLGVDIYRKVGKFNKSIVNTLSKTNRRDSVPTQLRVAHFLFFITNLLGSQPSRTLINEFEIVSRDIMIQMASNNPINKTNSGENLCRLLESEGACVVIDYHIGSVPTCLKRYSVFHNVGLLDPAEKGVLPWGEVIGEGGCIETSKQKSERKKKEKKQKELLKASKTKEERKAKARATREQRQKNERNRQIAEARARNLAKREAMNRRAKMAERRGLLTNRAPNRPNVSMNTNRNRVVNVLPKMEDFDLFLRAGNVNNETVKGLLNKIIRNQNRFNIRQKPKIRNVLNKILRRTNQPQNLNSAARNIKAKMFPTNNRQLRSRT